MIDACNAIAVQNAPETPTAKPPIRAVPKPLNYSNVRVGMPKGGTI